MGGTLQRTFCSFRNSSFQEETDGSEKASLSTLSLISRRLLNLTILQNSQVNTLIVGVDEILDQIVEIKNCQKSQLVRNGACANCKRLTMYL